MVMWRGWVRALSADGSPAGVVGDVGFFEEAGAVVPVTRDSFRLRSSASPCTRHEIRSFVNVHATSEFKPCRCIEELFYKKRDNAVPPNRCIVALSEESSSGLGLDHRATDNSYFVIGAHPRNLDAAFCTC
jgi:hypothetical protein